ncbi:MAG: hypothetical protein LBP51_00820 [Deferribacteraceae bacterium]|jgi:hypothetical protein|nr:hypothetical protein [Deferribacteraceae bacterium]
MRWFILPILFLAPVLSFAEPIGAVGAIGEGCDAVREKALKYALDDLASQIEVYVSSKLYFKGSSAAEGALSYFIRTETDIPIYAYKTERKGECTRVSFDMSKAPNAYKSRASELARQINAFTKTDKINDSVKNANYMKAIPLYQELSKVKAAARFLGVETVEPNKTREEIETELIAMRAASGDIEQIANNIRAGITYKNYYAYPPVITGTTSVTPFGTALARLISTGASLENAHNILSCEFDPSKEQFLIVCILKDRLGKPLQTATAIANRSVCENISCESTLAYKKLEAMRRFHGDMPTNRSEELSSVWTSTLRGYFYTDKSLFKQEPIYLKGGELLRLYARFSDDASAVVMVVSKDGGAYLLPLEENSPIKRAAAGFETELMRVKVEPPYEAETLYLLGVMGNIEDYLPQYSYNTYNGVYDINGSAGRILADFRRAVKDAPFYEGSLIIYSEVGS